MVSIEENKNVLRFQQLSTVVEKMTSVPCVILGGVMVAVVISGVFARYLLKNPMSWTEEVARFLMNWMALLGASIVTRHRAHLGLLYFIQKFPMSLQRLTKLLMDILIMIFLYLLTVEGFQMAMAASEQVEPTTGVTMNYILICVPLAGLLMMIQLSLQMIVDLFHWGTSKSPFEE
jgi:TRAP-type C4-dicarboxylate transport system permease small subunit